MAPESFLTGFPLGCSSLNQDISEVGSPLTDHGLNVALHHSHNRSVTISLWLTNYHQRDPLVSLRFRLIGDCPFFNSSSKGIRKLVSDFDKQETAPIDHRTISTIFSYEKKRRYNYVGFFLLYLGIYFCQPTSITIISMQPDWVVWNWFQLRS